MSRVTFIDTSVLCELLEVPGKAQQAPDVNGELQRRVQQGERFVIPVTAVIETGNHIAQASSGDRYAAAQRLLGLLRATIAGDRSFLRHEFTWDAGFVEAICDGGSTGEDLAQRAAARMGAGDVAILVERDRFVASSVFCRDDVDLWTLDVALAQYA